LPIDLQRRNDSAKEKKTTNTGTEGNGDRAKSLTKANLLGLGRAADKGEKLATLITEKKSVECYYECGGVRGQFESFKKRRVLNHRAVAFRRWSQRKSEGEKKQRQVANWGA